MRITGKISNKVLNVMMAIFVMCLLGTSAQAASETLFTTQTPVDHGQSDGANVNYELGTMFRSNTAGQIIAIRFWKDANETGTHTGHIWSGRGRLLASVMFVDETVSGWQQQALATPLTIAASTSYVVTVNTGNTYYVSTTSGLASKITNGNLNTVVGNDGAYGPPGAFPTNSWNASNYFRDVVFAGGTSTITAPAPSLILSSSSSSLNFGSVNVSNTSSQTVTLTNAGNSTITISNVSVSGAGFNASGVSTGLMLSPGQTASLTATFDPSATGAVAGSVAVASNATNSPDTISLSGTGVPVENHFVGFSWTPSVSSVIGYNTYFATKSSGPFMKMTSSPTTLTLYTDSNVQAGSTYFFVVTSVDSSNMESTFSNEISATIP